MFQLFHLPVRQASAQPALDLKDLKQLAFPAFANKSCHLLQLPFVKKLTGEMDKEREKKENRMQLLIFFGFVFVSLSNNWGYDLEC